MSIFTPSQLSLLMALVIAFAVIHSEADICPDHKMSCRKGQTCCAEAKGGYGCCPYENASCCSDGLHCCPQGTQCDLSGGRCRRSSRTINQVKLLPSDTLHSEPRLQLGNSLGFMDSLFNSTKKRCPDHEASCPDTYTCCGDPSGGFACCPFPNATCCSDKIHCCPQGQTCNDSKCE